MDEGLTREEVALLIRGRRLLKDKGLSRDLDVKGICEVAGVSRKTGYQWAGQTKAQPSDQEQKWQEAFNRLKSDHEALKKDYEDVRFENEGRKIAWKIHGVEAFLAGKKNPTRSRRKPKR